MGKDADFVGHGRPGRGKEVAVLQPDGLLQQGVDRAFVELVLQAQHQGRHLAHADIVQIVLAPHLQGIQHQGTAQGAFVGNALVHALVHLLPEAGHAAHHRGTHLAERLLHVGRIQIDAHQHAAPQAEVGPRLLEDVGEGEEIERHVPVGQNAEQLVVHAEYLIIIAIPQHHALRFACRARGVEDVHQVMLLDVGGALGNQRLVRQVAAQGQELVPIEGGQVARVFLHRAVEDDELLQGFAEAEDGECGIILELLAHEEEADSGIVHDILHLQRRAGGIERDGDGAVGKGREVRREALRLVLREDAHVLQLIHAEGHQGIGRQAHGTFKLSPRDREPFSPGIVPVLQGHPVSILCRLPVHQHGHFL